MQLFHPSRGPLLKGTCRIPPATHEINTRPVSNKYCSRISHLSAIQPDTMPHFADRHTVDIQDVCMDSRVGDVRFVNTVPLNNATEGTDRGCRISCN